MKHVDILPGPGPSYRRPEPVAAERQPEPRLARGSAAHVIAPGLADALAEMPPFDATHVVATWALSDDRQHRLAVVEALAQVMPLGARTALAHLACDTDPEIRASALDLLASA